MWCNKCMMYVMSPIETKLHKDPKIITILACPVCATALNATDVIDELQKDLDEMVANDNT